MMKDLEEITGNEEIKVDFEHREAGTVFYFWSEDRCVGYLNLDPDISVQARWRLASTLFGAISPVCKHVNDDQEAAQADAGSHDEQPDPFRSSAITSV
jgi:hypothetical protein